MLFERVVEQSKATNWHDAKMEWFTRAIYYLEKDAVETCTCGHFPIKNVIEIENRITGNILIVGNCCIEKFEDSDDYKGVFNYSLFFSGLRKGELNKAIVDKAKLDGIINEWEFTFLNNVRRKRHFSKKQVDCLKRIENRVISIYIK